jgi:hypothetical protein
MWYIGKWGEILFLVELSAVKFGVVSVIWSGITSRD